MPKQRDLKNQIHERMAQTGEAYTTARLALTKRAIKSIPTMYNGVQFRSRLEAKWAVMFDTLGWRWSYEPLDLDGWLPDFRLHPLTAKGKSVLVEVKPFELCSQELIAKMESAARGLEDDLLLLTEVLFPLAEAGGFLGERETWGSPQFAEIGLLGQRAVTEATPARTGAAFWENWPAQERFDGWHWAGCVLGKDLPSPEWDVCSSLLSYAGSLTGGYDGNPLVLPEGPNQVVAFWANAGNLVQWHPRR